MTEETMTFMELRSAPAAIKRLQEKPVSGDVQILINDYEALVSPTLSKSPPAVPGWYWCVQNFGSGAEVREVVRVEPMWDNGPLTFRFGPYDYRIEQANQFLWCGPIVEPKGVQP